MRGVVSRREICYNSIIKHKISPVHLCPNETLREPRAHTSFAPAALQESLGELPGTVYRVLGNGETLRLVMAIHPACEERGAFQCGESGPARAQLAHGVAAARSAQPYQQCELCGVVPHPLQRSHYDLRYRVASSLLLVLSQRLILQLDFVAPHCLRCGRPSIHVFEE